MGNKIIYNVELTVRNRIYNKGFIIVNFEKQKLIIDGVLASDYLRAELRNGELLFNYYDCNNSCELKRKMFFAIPLNDFKELLVNTGEKIVSTCNTIIDSAIIKREYVQICFLSIVKDEETKDKYLEKFQNMIKECIFLNGR